MDDRQGSDVSDLDVGGPDQVIGEVVRRELWALSVAAAGIGTFDWDLVTGRLAWDDALVDLFGYRRGEFDESLEAFNARVHPEDLPEVTARLSAAIDTGGEYEAAYRVLAPGRPLRWVTARGRALADPDGVSVRVLGAAWDTTAHHEAAAEVAGIVEDLPVGFFAVDHDWRLTHVNAATEAIAAVQRAEVLGRSYWDVFPAAVGTLFEDSYRRAVVTGEVVTFEAHYPDPIDVWVEVRAVPTASGLSVYFLDVTSQHHAAEVARAAAERAALLGRITEELLAQDDPEQAAARLGDLVVPVLGDWAIVTLTGDGASTGRRALRTAGAVHSDPAAQPVLELYAVTRLEALREEAPVVRTVVTGAPQVVDGGATERMLAVLDPGPAREAMTALAPEHLATYPLAGRGGTIGTLTLGRGAARAGFSGEDHVTATHVAARAGVVLDNARLHRQQRNMAIELQRSLLTPPPEPDHLQISVRYAATAEAAEVGGDWYDAFITADGTTSLVIGDVTGHDMRAAAVMGQYRNLLRGIGHTLGRPPAAVLSALDRAAAGLGMDTIATVLLAQVEQDDAHRAAGTRVLRWANAGHLPPLLISPDGATRYLDQAEPDLVIGVDADADRRDHELVLQPGQTVLLYTDGLVERRGADVEQGLAWLARAASELAGEPLEELCDALLALVDDHPADDIALLALRAHPQDRPRPVEAGPVVLPAPLAAGGEQQLQQGPDDQRRSR